MPYILEDKLMLRKNQVVENQTAEEQIYVSMNEDEI